MSQKEIKTRIILKHDTEENWRKAESFIPRLGEVIIYDTDTNNTYARCKIGDGTTPVNELSFAVNSITNEEIDEVCGITAEE